MSLSVSRFGALGSFALAWVLIAARLTTAAELKEATVTQIVNEVELLPTGLQGKLAALNDRVRDETALHTRADSRIELTFTDQTLARSSANTAFSFDKGMRNLDLADGAMLLRVPKGASGMKIQAAPVTAVVTGTAIVEYHAHAYLKFINLEGTARLYLKRRLGESVLVRPGQILITNPDAKNLPTSVDVDLERLLKTARLIVDFPSLGSQSLITKEIDKQQRAKSKRRLTDTNLVIFGKGTLVSLTNPGKMNVPSQASLSSAASKPSAIPSSDDLGIIETVPLAPQSASGPIEASSENRAADMPR